jgi:hypothetical protein
VRATRSALAAATLLVAAACATPGDRPDADRPAPSPKAQPVHSPLLVTDNGGRFSVEPGTTILVRLAGPGTWGPLAATAGSVEEVHYRTDPGYREWQVTPPRDGETVLTSVCDGCGGPRHFRVTLVVG